MEPASKQLLFSSLDAIAAASDPVAAVRARNEFARRFANAQFGAEDLDGMLNEVNRRSFSCSDPNGALSNIEHTLSLELVMRELQGCFSSAFELGFVSGSLAYAPYVRIRQASDIDLTLVTDRFEPAVARRWPFENVDEIERALHAARWDDTAQINVRTTLRSKTVAIHFTSRRWYERVCALEISDGPTPHRVRRIAERPEIGVFPGRYNFLAQEHTWRSKTGMHDGLYYIDQDDFAFDSEGRFVNGVLVDMFSVSRYFFGDQDLFDQNHLKLLSRLSARYHEERRNKLFGDARASFTNIFHSHAVFADFYKQRLSWCE